MPKRTTEKNTDREVLYPDVKVSLRAGEKAITQAQAEQLLGWHIVEDGDKGEHLLKVDEDRIRCSNNVTNRPLYSQSVSLVKQEVLRKHWQLNGEPIIVGKTGLILNGQHTLIGFILACIEWEKNPEDYPQWEEEPTLEKVIVFGIDESDEVVNTMDTCKPRSLADVIYRSTYFAEKSTAVRKKIAGTTSHALRMLWHRTGIASAFELQKSHSEFTEMLNHHPTLLKAVEWIHDEDGGSAKNISRYLSAGYASAILYLMASSSSSGDYFKQDQRDESQLSFDNWDAACEFWVMLTSGKEGLVIRKAIGHLIEDGDGSRQAKLAVIVKAWYLYANGEKITSAKLKLKYHEAEDHTRTLAETPTVGGIDLGGPNEEPELKPVTVAKSEEKAPSEAPKPAKTRKRTARRKKAAQKGTQSLSEGTQVRCLGESEDETWSGTLVELGTTVSRVEVAPGFAGEGNVYEHPTDRIEAA